MGDEAYIKELAEYLKEQNAGRNREMDENERARHGADFTLADVPEAFRKTTQIINLPRNQDVLQRFGAIVTDDDPAITVPPASIKDTDRRRANKCERWLAGSLDRTRQESGRDAWRMAADNALALGLGVLKSYPAQNAWDAEPAKEDTADGYVDKVRDYRKTAPFPIRLYDIDPRTYYPHSDGYTTTEVLEICERPFMDTLRALRVEASVSGDKRHYRKLAKGQRFPEGRVVGAPKTIKVIERWRLKGGQQVMIDNQLIEENDLQYGRLPYFPVCGYTTSSRDPEYATRSAIASMRPLVKHLNRLLSIWSNWAILGGWPYMVAPEGEDGDGETQSSIELGSILKSGTKFLEPPSAGRDLHAMAQLLQAEADRVGLASVMYGSGAGTSSGYQVASLQAAAQSVLRPAIRNIALGLSDLFAFWLMLVDRALLAGPAGVPVWGKREKGKGNEWVDLSADDIRGYYVVKCELRPLMPLDEIAQRDSALRMVEGRLWPKRHALEKTGESAPEELLDDVAVEQYIEMPEIGMRIAEDAAIKNGLIKPKPTPILGPNGQTLSTVDTSQQGMPPGLGGPGIPEMQGIQPSVPGQTMPLVPPPNGAGGRPVGVQRQPGGPNDRGPM